MKSKIIFASNRDNDNGRYSLYRVNADGTGLEQLTDNPDVSNDRAPAVSPDGRTLAFASYSQGAIWGINLLELDNGNPLAANPQIVP